MPGKDAPAGVGEIGNDMTKRCWLRYPITPTAFFLFYISIGASVQALTAARASDTMPRASNTAIVRLLSIIDIIYARMASLAYTFLCHIHIHIC